MEETKKIGFVGEKSSIEFFRIFGADIFHAETVEQAENIMKEIKLADYAVVFITEEVFDRDIFSKYLLSKKMLAVPSLVSNTGKGYKIVEDLIRKATGMKE